MKKLIILCLSLSSLACFTALPKWNNPYRMNWLLVDLKESHIEWEKRCCDIEERVEVRRTVASVVGVYAYVEYIDELVDQDDEDEFAWQIDFICTELRNS